MVRESALFLLAVLGHSGMSWAVIGYLAECCFSFLALWPDGNQSSETSGVSCEAKHRKARLCTAEVLHLEREGQRSRM